MHDAHLTTRRSGFAELPARRKARGQWLSDHARAQLVYAGWLALKLAVLAASATMMVVVAACILTQP